MNITINEYIHERFTQHQKDGVWVSYGTFNNLAVLVVAGTIYIDGKKSYPFRGFSAPFGRLVFDENHNGPPKVIASVFDGATGRIAMKWEHYPGEHILCVSYNFTGEAGRLSATKDANWLQEGF